MINGGRRATLALIVAGVCLVGTACQSGEWRGDQDAASVAVIGDSIVYQAETDATVTEVTRVLTDELVAAGYRAHVSGWVGETIVAGYHDLWPQVANEPGLDIVVIALGTNDVNRDVPLEDSRVVLRTWLAATDDIGCVALVGVNESAYAWELDVYGPAFNAMLHDEAASRPNAIFVEWAPDLALHGYDGDVHLTTPEAKAQFRRTVAGAVDWCAARLDQP